MSRAKKTLMKAQRIGVYDAVVKWNQCDDGCDENIACCVADDGCAN